MTSREPFTRIRYERPQERILPEIFAETIVEVNSLRRPARGLERHVVGQLPHHLVFGEDEFEGVIVVFGGKVGDDRAVIAHLEHYAPAAPEVVKLRVGVAFLDLVAELSVVGPEVPDHLLANPLQILRRQLHARRAGPLWFRIV